MKIMVNLELIQCESFNLCVTEMLSGIEAEKHHTILTKNVMFW